MSRCRLVTSVEDGSSGRVSGARKDARRAAADQRGHGPSAGAEGREEGLEIPGQSGLLQNLLQKMMKSVLEAR